MDQKTELTPQLVLRPPLQAPPDTQSLNEEFQSATQTCWFSHIHSGTKNMPESAGICPEFSISSRFHSAALVQDFIFYLKYHSQFLIGLPASNPAHFLDCLLLEQHFSKVMVGGPNCPQGRHFWLSPGGETGGGVDGF